MIERTDEPAAARQPADPRGQGGALRPRRRRRRSRGCARCRLVLGRATWARATWRPSSTGWRPSRPAEQPLRDPRHPPSARPDSHALDLRPRRRIQPAWPFDRRASAPVTTNKLVASLVGDLFGLSRPGVSALRLREEGPADDLLPDLRHGAHPPARRARARRFRRRSTTSRRSARASAPRPRRRWHGLRAVAARRTRGDLGRRSRRGAPVIARARHPRWPRSTPPGLARVTRPRPDLVHPHAGRSRWSACSFASRRSPSGPAWAARALMRAVTPALRRFFGKRGGASSTPIWR